MEPCQSVEWSPQTSELPLFATVAAKRTATDTGGIVPLAFERWDATPASVTSCFEAMQRMATHQASTTEAGSCSTACDAPRLPIADGWGDRRSSSLPQMEMRRGFAPSQAARAEPWGSAADDLCRTE